MMQEISTEILPVKAARGFRHAITAILFAAAALLSGHAGSAPLDFYALPYTFTDDQARTVHLSEWRGKPLILTMEYSECRFMCTTTFSKLRSIQTAADQLKIPIDFVIVSLDPKNDTPEAWRQYKKSREVDRSNWHMLTGTEAVTKEFSRLIGIKYWYMDEHILHDFKIVRLNAQGQIEKEITDYSEDADYLLK